MLCDRCNRSQATVFSTAVFYHGEHPGDCTSRQRNLCLVCADSEDQDPASKMAAALEAGCYYCGKKGVLVCSPCAAELRRINEEKGYSLPKGRPTREEMRHIAKIREEVAEHMKKWVAEGGPDQPGR